MSGRRVVAAAVGLAAAAACMPAGAHPEMAPAPTAETRWDSVRARSLRELRDGDPFTADSLLEAFALEWAGTPEAAESLFWRAVTRLDPQNSAATPRHAIAAIDAYLALGADQPRYEEAVILRRVATALDSLRRPALTVSAPPPLAADSSALRAKDEEIKKLREELQRTQAELERIRKRLGAPRP